MECLLTGTRHWLRSSVSQIRSFPVGTDPSFASYRQYVLVPTPRRMNGHSQSDQPNTPASLEETAEPLQAYPLSGYYSLILKSNSPYAGGAPTSRPTPTRPEAKPTPASTVAPQSPQERMAIVFGSPLTGPGRTSRYNPGEAPPESMWKTINGVPIPPQPEEPDNCCMSGCVHCVWDDFRDEMEDWASRITMAKAKGGPEKGTRDMRWAPRAEVRAASGSMDDDGGGSETNWTLPSEHDDLFSNIPVGIREFMKTEKRLRVKRQHEGLATV
ncbi:hypothetical protein DTO013E5_6984 [Penicillium roqueforti]|uniref:Oxidoreductase-like, N-terminal n=1 Tax=Penicillium roqueforti (strain FM164) TaxID=1365484 RepID=W6QAT4_PENRF|nr:uncharacterized protein LCP9604111_8340 [Penicillium roqueforti]CDM26822.1 Oxidoreductase-like, N-terminal [Penicillium roqueforti FM164]KAF9241731.1 hypothetical protein LCP9604111_8340 [Penicillium roqueforti]KAI1833580.1 hypothetical protein CBS147337_5619 [Penicillium roqueforti]KAI2673004.1 hypothetical protein CBS147355_7807 [Penicillium roqueforti]KAI2674282.1 hypothetical protein LCP963914a_8898 [Penicillium roqueforti]